MLNLIATKNSSFTVYSRTPSSPSSQVPGILDAMSSFDRCSDGLKIALLVVVPSFYITSSLLFLLLGLVMQWWEKRSKDKGHYMTFNADDKVIMRPH